MMKLRGLSGTVVWADGELSISHTAGAQQLGAPAWVQIPEGLVIGVALQEPTLLHNGMLQVRVAGIDHQKMEPGDPYTVVFTRRSRSAFRDLQHRLETLSARRDQ